MPNNRKSIKKLLIGIVIFFVVVCIVIVISQIPMYVPSVKEAFNLIKPEILTELYFENHLSLPNKIILFKENNFDFTIHNLENKDMEYLYEVYMDINGEKQVIDNNSVTIKKNDFKTIKESFIILIPAQRIKVIVSLINKNQQIDFWMDQE